MFQNGARDWGAIDGAQHLHGKSQSDSTLVTLTRTVRNRSL